jgi:hypothetical protein
VRSRRIRPTIWDHDEGTGGHVAVHRPGAAACVAQHWARLVSQLRRQGRRVPLNDTWIAATALARGFPVVTQDADYDPIDGLDVIRV